MSEIFSSVLAYRIFDLLLVVVFFQTKTSALLKGNNQYAKINYLIAQDKRKSSI
jgi:hypothetical protein